MIMHARSITLKEIATNVVSFLNEVEKTMNKRMNEIQECIVDNGTSSIDALYIKI